MLPELGDRVDGLFGLKRETTDLVVDEASYQFELHGTVVAEVHVLKEIVVGRAIQPENQCVCVSVCV